MAKKDKEVVVETAPVPVAAPVVAENLRTPFKLKTQGEDVLVNKAALARLMEALITARTGNIVRGAALPAIGSLCGAKTYEEWQDVWDELKILI